MIPGHAILANTAETLLYSQCIGAHTHINILYTGCPQPSFPCHVPHEHKKPLTLTDRNQAPVALLYTVGRGCKGHRVLRPHVARKLEITAVHNFF